VFNKQRRVQIMSSISADRITKVFKGRTKDRSIVALSEFSLDVGSGEIFGLLGPNGAGKTTFIKVLLEIVFPTSGSATVLGEKIGSVAAKSRIGYLPENHKYPAYLTGEQVLRYFGKLSGIAAPRLESEVTRLLTLVEMDKWRKVKIRKYSKGMLQRVGLAQALINDPRLVILDEPTDGVDPIGRKQIRDILSRLRDAGTSVFLNSHLLSEVELVCDRVAILNKGKMVRQGTVKELTQQEHVYIVAFEGGFPEALRVQWDATRVPFSCDGNLLSVTVANTRELNDRIDALRSASVQIKSIEQKHTSLEDMFIDVISKEKS
jgi:ABC-2 type transport system ATP-binding protein